MSKSAQSPLPPEPEEDLRARLFPRLLATCQRALGEKVEARELAEDVWTDFVLLHAARLKSEQAAEAYLRIAALRRARRRQQLEARQAPMVEREDERSSPEAALIEADEEQRRARQLSSCMEQLDDAARRLLRLRYHLGLTQESIGRQLGVSKQYAGRILAKAVDRLRACVEAAA